MKGSAWSIMLATLRGDLPGAGTKRLIAARLLAIYFIRRDTRKALLYIRFGHMFRRLGWHWPAKAMSRGLRRKFGCFVAPGARIGPGVRLPHPNGIVIGEGVAIGRRCSIYQQVTLGGVRPGDWQAGRYPRVGNDVVLYADAKIGALTIGDACVAGANTVVTRDVPARHSAAGVPAINRLRASAHVASVQPDEASSMDGSPP